MPSQTIRIGLKAYDHNLLDKSTARIVQTAKSRGCYCGADSAAHEAFYRDGIAVPPRE